MQGRLRARIFSSWSAVGLATAATFTTPPCAADSPGPVVVWYRASPECPAGSEFLTKLSGPASGARLAQAGDHLDFVVTLQATSGDTLGRLERQTEGGTVAIRELRDASCQRVADALALSLTLALEPPDAALQEPAAASPGPVDSAEGAQSRPHSPENQQSREARRRESPPASPVTNLGTTAALKDAISAAPLRPAKSVRWWLGAQGGAITGVAPHPLSRVAAFIDDEGALGTLAPRVSFRVGAVGVRGSTTTEIGSVSRWLLGGRVEGCPWRWGSLSSIRPCIVLELGAVGGRGERASGRGDVGLWAAPGAALRGGLALANRLRLEAEAGALFPLLRHDVYAGSSPLYRAEVASVYAALGLSLGVP